jgi:streptogramin lyase
VSGIFQPKSTLLIASIALLPGCIFGSASTPSLTPARTSSNTVVSLSTFTPSLSPTSSSTTTLTPSPTATAKITYTPSGPVAFKTYSLNADFDLGTLHFVGHDDRPDELGLLAQYKRFNFIWVPISTQGKIAKVDINTGRVAAVYLTSPSSSYYPNPQSVAVDYDGSVWAANRGDNSIVHIGLLENGQCVDRNRNGKIDTSTGWGDLRVWGGLNGGSVATANDECITQYLSIPEGARNVAVNKDNNVWVNGRELTLVNGSTGQIIKTINEPLGPGGDGDFILDRNEVIWSAYFNLLHWDTTTSYAMYTAYFVDNSSYGLCMDSHGNIWNTSTSGNKIRKFSPEGTLLGSYAYGGEHAKGCVIDGNDHVWVAHFSYSTDNTPVPQANTVGHLLPDGTFIGNVVVGDTPTGLSVDNNGKIWVSSYTSGTIARIDPTAGASSSIGVKIGAVDFTSIPLGNMITFDDMTGSRLRRIPQTGQWEVILDSGIDKVRWGKISWTSNACGDSQILVMVSSSTDPASYIWKNFSAPVEVKNGNSFTIPDGRFLRIVVNFQRSTAGQTPILYDLSVGTAEYTLPILPSAPEMVCFS